MKTLACFLFLAELAVLPAAAAPPQAEKGADWQVGAARVDITPLEPVRLSGYAVRTTPMEGVEDRIHARALALRDAQGVLTVLMAVDSIGVPGAVREDVVGAIRDRLGIYHVRLSITSTHSHATPHLEGYATNLFELAGEEREAVRRYTRFLTGKLVEAIDAALKALAPARLVHGESTCAFARNRRQAGGPVDHQLPVLAALDPSGSLRAVAFLYACHATTLEGSHNRVSGDWPGRAADLVEAAHPGAVCLPLIGCGGDANPEPRGKPEHVQVNGESAARAVEEALRGGLRPLPLRLDAQLEYVHLPYAALPGEEELRRRTEKGPEHHQRNARRHLERLRGGGKLAPTHAYPLQVLSFPGELVVVLLAGEVVVDYALLLKKELAPRRVWVAAYTNDVPCYIASRRVLAEGGYEADDSMVWYGHHSRWDPGIEDLIVSKVKALVEASESGTAARVKPRRPLSAEEARDAFRLPPGFRIELAAAEPEVTDPVAIAFDEEGRLFAAEMRDYPLGPGEGKPWDGRVRLLEDVDGDGSFERSTLFAEHVPYPTGVACWGGGVYVTAAPDILYLKDTSGDGRADLRQVVFTGFNLGNSQHLLNTLRLGPEGWIHVNGGDSARITSPLRPEAPPVSARASNFRFDPRTHRIETTTGYQGGYGIAFTLEGERIVCDNQVHGLHVVLPREALERNPHLRVEETVEDLSDHGRAVFPLSRPLERFNDPWDSGRFSSACGVHVYTGDAFPGSYRGNLFSCEPVSNLVHRDDLAAAGSTFTARRGEPDREFLASSDHWFRPVSCETGPDGCLYVVDMYREVIEHPQWIPEHMQKLFDLRSGMDHGRIWRVVHESAPGAARKRVSLGGAKTEALVERLSHLNGWHRWTAQRLLLERGAGEAVPILETALRAGPEPLARLHALWTLEGLGKLDREALLAGLRDPSPAVRAAAADAFLRRPAAPRSPEEKELTPALAKLSGDEDPRVRFHAALALGTLPEEERQKALAVIGLRDAADRWTRTAVLASLAAETPPGEARAPAATSALTLLEALLRAGPEGPGRAELIRGVARLQGARGEKREVASSLDLLAREPRPESFAWQAPAVAALLGGLASGRLEEVLAEGARTRPQLEALLELAARRAADPALELSQREAAVALTAFDPSGRALPLLRGLLEPRHPAEVQRAAVRALAGLRLPAARGEATALLVEAFASLTPPVRSEVLEALLAGRERVAALLGALEEGKIRPAEVDLARRERLLAHPEAALRDRAARALGELAADRDRAEVVERYRRVLGEPGAQADLRRGEELFIKHCSPCHRAGDRGAAVGADLSGMRERSADALLQDILDPSRAVAPEYVSYTILTRDGRVLTGMLAAETSRGVTLKQAEGKIDSVPRGDIQELRSTGSSLMPAGFEKELSPRDAGDVIAFIRSGLAVRSGPPAAGGGRSAGAAPAPSTPPPGARPAGGRPAGSRPAEAPRSAPAGEESTRRAAGDAARLREALTFHAPFDSGPEAAFARGDPRLYTASELYKRDFQAGLHTPSVSVVEGKGRHGGALQFRRKEKPAVLFKAEGNLEYRKTDWSGTVSLWLSLDPDEDLEPGFADPVQVTEREWNDGAFFVDFSKDERPRHFRLGVFADRGVWDPARRDWEAVPAVERPLVTVTRKVFGRGKWTHVAFTFSRFNTGKAEGVARLYLDGELQGSLEGRRQTFTWDPSRTAIWLGLSTIGLMDDLAIFNRELTAEEIRILHRLENGVKSLGR